MAEKRKDTVEGMDEKKEVEEDSTGRARDAFSRAATSTKPGRISRFLNFLRTLPSPGFGVSSGICQVHPFLTAPSILPSLQSILILLPVMPHFSEAVATSIYFMV